MLMDMLNLEFAGIRNKVDLVINDCKREFDNHRSAFEIQNAKFVSMFMELEEKMKNAGGHKKEDKSNVPMKTLVPQKFVDKVEGWRQWKDDVVEYFDMTKTGVKAYMDAVTKRGDNIDEMFKQVWAGSVGQHVVEGLRTPVLEGIDGVGAHP